MIGPVLRIENLDDIEIEAVDRIQLFQTKLKLKSEANLTNASVDFWKTVRVWSEGIKSSVTDPDNTIFTLITTESVPDDSLIYDFKLALRSDSEAERNVTPYAKGKADDRLM